MTTNPYAYAPFTCSGCMKREIPANGDHGILPSGGILCRRCFAKHDGEVAVLAPNRAAAVAVLTARGFMAAPTTKEH
ncbi:hypothetical protein GCM10009775_02840 [Microbacterium aoyamense]|uniref:Uncharacterized protein n=1 Tax=Microbacterium aoyamense TaxID=344166 RepID=A0ABN2P906_9MICO|nr:hypothetical protein [Microbacterium aoyamense]